MVIETIFSLPRHRGRLVIQGILRRDYPVIKGGLLVTAVAFVMINLIVDVLYSASTRGSASRHAPKSARLRRGERHGAEDLAVLALNERV